MAIPTYTLISSVTVGSGGASSIQFTSIPATYTDLKIVASLRSVTTATAETCYIYVNSGTSGTSRYLSGNGAAASSGTSIYMPVGDINAASSTASTFTNLEVYIPNYLASQNKSMSIESAMENNATTAYAQMWADLWSSTNAITTLELDATGNFAQYSTAYLYGIKNS